MSHMSYHGASLSSADLDPALTEPLLGSHLLSIGQAPADDVESEDSRSFTDDVPDSKRQLGLLSAAFLIFNRVLGSGIFIAPSVILSSSGSVGMSFVMWILGTMVAFAGTAVYVEFGTGLPRSGGEKTYLEYLFRRPAFMATCVYAVYGIFVVGTFQFISLHTFLIAVRIYQGWITPQTIVFGEYALHAFGYGPTPTNVRGMAILCSTFCFVVHGVFFNFGRRLQNALGMFKLVVLVLIAVSGLLSLLGMPGFTVGKDYDQPNNYTWRTFWDGSSVNANAFVTGIYTVIWSYAGYSNANYALSEVRDPVRTIKLAAPLAMSLVGFVYLSVNMAYFAVVSKGDILHGGAIPAALFFRNLFGPATERALSVIISLTLLGTILAILFAQGRVVQELGREGVLPYSSFFASNKPFNAPLPGLFTQYLISVLLTALTPPGDAFVFLFNHVSYPAAMFNFFISGGLLLLHTDAFKSYNWNPPFRAHRLVIAFFFLSNTFLVVFPLIPPSDGHGPYEYLPYYSHIAVAFFVGLLGMGYWFIVFHWLPQRNGYVFKRVKVIQDDGVPRNVLRRMPAHMERD